MGLEPTTRLERMQEAKALIPFVMLSYSEPSTYDWFDDTGHRRTLLQAEGCEQGDPLMPLLFAIGIQGASRRGVRVFGGR